MTTLVHQELFKLWKRKSTLILSGLLIIQIIAFAFLGKANPKIFPIEGIFFSNLTSLGWTTFVLIASAATIISSEFQYGTIKELVYREHSRSSILVSKWVTIFLYSAFLFVMTTVVTFICKIMIFNSEINLADKFSKNQTNLEHWGITVAGYYITLWFLLSLVFLLATLFKNSAVAVSLGIVGYFAVGIISSLQFTLIEKWEWLKWNPFNILNLANQLDYHGLEKMTKLSTPEMTISALIYITLFLVIGLWSFRKRDL